LIRRLIKSSIKLLAFVLLASGLVAGCGFQTYSPRPIDPTQSAARHQAHDVNSAEFSDYLISQGYTKDQIPIKEWGLRELTLSAFFFHPQLDIARAQWRAAEAEKITAGQRLNPGINGSAEHHSQHSGGISPWTYGIGLSIPIETGGKRQARIDRAESLSEATRIEIGNSAWQVRSNVRNNLIALQAANKQVELLQHEVALRSDIAAMLDARLTAGLISNIELSNARLQLQKAQQVMAAEQGHIPELRAVLAASAGLPLPSLDKIILKDKNFEPISAAELPNETIQREALLNRLDVRASLARYAAAEAKLKLEITKQYPDITLSPAYSFDQGDNRWSLGLSMLLALLDKNQGLIAEARALREVEAAQFDALQVKVITEMEQSQTRYRAALEQLQKAQNLQTSEQAKVAQTQRQFNTGFADRLELVGAQLEALGSKQNVFDVELKVQHALAALEDAMQRPLIDDAVMPANIEQSTTFKESSL
jgi:cobalt-zinc-cadmium efflux system outer membrane protein